MFAAASPVAIVLSYVTLFYIQFAFYVLCNMRAFVNLFKFPTSFQFSVFSYSHSHAFYFLLCNFIVLSLLIYNLSFYLLIIAVYLHLIAYGEDLVSISLVESVRALAFKRIPILCLASLSFAYLDRLNSLLCVLK